MRSFDLGGPLSNKQLAVFLVSTFQSATNAFDTALRYQQELKDDATLACWTAIGLEASTLGAILTVNADSAFDGGIPDLEDLQGLNFRTRSYSRLIAEARKLFPNSTYPADAETFATEVRNKLLHIGDTKHVGLTAMCLRLIRDTGAWLEGVTLPAVPLRHNPRVLEAGGLEEIPLALQKAAIEIACETVAFLRDSLADGWWDDTPDLKAVAGGELEECRIICDQ